MTTIVSSKPLDASESSMIPDELDQRPAFMTVAGDYRLEPLPQDDDDEAAGWAAASLQSLREWASENPE